MAATTGEATAPDSAAALAVLVDTPGSLLPPAPLRTAVNVGAVVIGNLLAATFVASRLAPLLGFTGPLLATLGVTATATTAVLVRRHRAARRRRLDDPTRGRPFPLLTASGRTPGEATTLTVDLARDTELAPIAAAAHALDLDLGFEPRSPRRFVLVVPHHEDGAPYHDRIGDVMRLVLDPLAAQVGVVQVVLTDGREAQPGAAPQPAVEADTPYRASGLVVPRLILDDEQVPREAAAWSERDTAIGWALTSQLGRAGERPSPALAQAHRLELLADLPFVVDGFDDWLVSGRPVFDLRGRGPLDPDAVRARLAPHLPGARLWVRGPDHLRVQHAFASADVWRRLRDQVLRPLHADTPLAQVTMGGYLHRLARRAPPR